MVKKYKHFPLWRILYSESSFNQVLKGGEKMHAYGYGGGYGYGGSGVGAGIIAIAVLILIALGVIF